MRVMVVVDLGEMAVAVVSMPPKAKLDDVFNRWFQSEQKTCHDCEEDLLYYELPVIKYKDLTIEGEDND